MNNYERIKQMSLDEMEQWLEVLHCKICNNSCFECWANNGKYKIDFKQWLQAESEE